MLDLVAGDYTLMIDAPGDQTAPYAFHLFDLSQASVIDLSQASVINPGTAADLVTTLSGIFTADNSFEIYVSTDDGTLGTFLTSGTDWTHAYTIPLTSLTQGVTNYIHVVAHNAGGPGGILGEFHLNNAQFTFPNGLTDEYTIPADWKVSLTGFGSGYSTPADEGAKGVSPWGSGTPLISASSHWIWNYVSNNSGDFNTEYFSMPVNPALLTITGTNVTGTLSPARETDLYRFTASAGDQFFFDGLSLSGGEAYWRLIDPFGKLVFDRTAFPTDVGVLTLEIPGTYTLLIEGRVTATGEASYSFNVDPRGNVPLAPPPAGTPLALGTTTTAAISVAGEQDRYSFTLGADTRVCFDSLTNNNNLVWTLTGPQGVIVLSRGFASSDSSAVASILDLGAGDYALTVSGIGSTTGSYSFRVLDLAQASALSFGIGGAAAVTGQLSPANETDFYSFTATAGERFYFDFVSLNPASSATWRLLDPFGGTVFGPTTLNATCRR